MQVWLDHARRGRRKNVGSKPNVSQAFLNRIPADNRIEIDFYRYAVDLVAARSALK